VRRGDEGCQAPRALVTRRLRTCRTLGGKVEASGLGGGGDWLEREDEAGGGGRARLSRMPTRANCCLSTVCDAPHGGGRWL
jgi:hypothetical protein